MKSKFSKTSIWKMSIVRAIPFVLAVSLLFTSCNDEGLRRKDYWTDINYPKYGIISIRIIPDSMHQEYLTTIKDLVRVGREKVDFIPENSLKYAKEIADQLYMRDAEALSIYLAEYQRCEIPYYHLDSTQRIIFNHLKNGNPQDTSKVELK